MFTTVWSVSCIVRNYISYRKELSGQGNNMEHWGYTKINGPESGHWLKVAPAGKGKRQSPINIVPANATFDENLASKPLKWSYTASNAETLENNSHSVQVTYKDEGSCLEGGPLSDKYQLKQFHLHWGKSNDRGSEHRINGEMYAAELHLVHWNTDKCSSFAEAAHDSNGLCVLGIFLKVGKEHAEIKRLTDLLTQVSHGGSNITMPHGIDPAALLPENTAEYWTYLGSLTTPPLLESVTWVVFKQPIEVSQKQMDAFRDLHENKQGQSIHNEFNGYIVENYRPPLPVGERVVRTTIGR